MRTKRTTTQVPCAGALKQKKIVNNLGTSGEQAIAAYLTTGLPPAIHREATELLTGANRFVAAWRQMGLRHAHVRHEMAAVHQRLHAYSVMASKQEVTPVAIACVSAYFGARGVKVP